MEPQTLAAEAAEIFARTLIAAADACASSTTASASRRGATPSVVRLYTRGGHDFTKRFPLVAAAVAMLSARSCLIDGEAIVSDDPVHDALYAIERGAVQGLLEVVASPIGREEFLGEARLPISHSRGQFWP